MQIRLVAASACLIACGARTPLNDQGPDGSGADSGALHEAASDALDELGPDSGGCETPEGVRICGGVNNCPWLEPPSCRGHGCTETGADADAGVCWTDLPDVGNRLCSACNDGEVCVFRGANELICVAEDVCQTLWDAGDTVGCRYADKSTYTNATLPSPLGPCPGDLSGQLILCGGACGGCPGTPCVGRSPGRPFGVCAWQESGASQGAISTCSVPPGAYDCTDHTQACAVFAVQATNESLAMMYGICMPASDCAKAAQFMPGGLHRY